MHVCQCCKDKNNSLGITANDKTKYINVCCYYYFYYRFQKSDFFLVLCYQRGKTFFFPCLSRFFWLV